MPHYQRYLLVGFLILGLFQAGWAQTQPVQNLSYRFEYPNVIVTYDLVAENPNREFTIELKAQTRSGRVFTPSALSGDVGENIPMGNGKQILWNVITDEINLQQGEELAFDVVATPQKTSEELRKEEEARQEEIRKQQEQEQQQKQQEAQQQAQQQNQELQQELAAIKTPSIMGSMVLTTLWPGWGSARYKESNAAAVWGIVGYGALGSYLLFHNNAQQFYDDYQKATDFNNREVLYEDAEAANSTAMIAAYTALGVWSMEYIKVLIRGSKAKKQEKQLRQELLQSHTSVDWNYYYNPQFQAPMVSLAIRF